MKFLAEVYEPMYDHNDKKYIRLIIPENYADIILRMHNSKFKYVKNKIVDNPLTGYVLTIKVPFRYRRVMCSVYGRPVQSLIKGDKVEVEIEFMGVWNIGEHSGYSWKLNKIREYDDTEIHN